MVYSKGDNLWVGVKLKVMFEMKWKTFEVWKSMNFGIFEWISKNFEMYVISKGNKNCDKTLSKTWSCKCDRRKFQLQ